MDSRAVEAVQVGTTLVVVSGWSLAEVWRLSLPRLEWSLLRTVGEIPNPRTDFCCVPTNQPDQLLLLGGSPAHGQHRSVDSFMPCFEFDVRSGLWRRFLAFGDSPAPRSHHAAALAPDGKAVFVHGGRLLGGANPSGSAIGDADSTEGVFVLNLVTKVWRFVKSDTVVPSLWGHRMASFVGAADNTPYVVMFGGVATRPAQGEGQAMSAEFSSAVFVWNLTTGNWGVLDGSAIDGDNDAVTWPSPRAMHHCVVRGQQLILARGIGLQPESGGGAALGFADDDETMWALDMERSVWTKSRFPSNEAAGAAPLLMTAYAGQTVVALDTEGLYIDDGAGDWYHMGCRVSNTATTGVGLDDVPGSHVAPPQAGLPSADFSNPHHIESRHSSPPGPPRDDSQALTALEAVVERLRAEEESFHAAASLTPFASPVDSRSASVAVQLPPAAVAVDKKHLAPEEDVLSLHPPSGLRPAIRNIVMEVLGPQAIPQHLREPTPVIDTAPVELMRAADDQNQTGLSSSTGVAGGGLDAETGKPDGELEQDAEGLGPLIDMRRVRDKRLAALRQRKRSTRRLAPHPDGASIRDDNGMEASWESGSHELLKLREPERFDESSRLLPSWGHRETIDH